MKVLSLVAVLFVGLTCFAQTDTKDIVSFNQFKEAKTVQDLFPDTYGKVEGVLSYNATVAIERQEPKEFAANSAYITGDIKKMVLENAGNGKDIYIYFDVFKNTEDGKTKVGSTVVSVK